MRKSLWIALASLLLAAGPAAAETGVYRHVVMFQFKDGTPADEVRKIEQAFAALPKKIDVIKAYEWGTNVSPEGHSDGLTHCFLVTFANKDDLEKVYLPHAAHSEFVSLLKPHLAKAVVVDFVAQAGAK